MMTMPEGNTKEPGTYIKILNLLNISKCGSRGRTASSIIYYRLPEYLQVLWDRCMFFNTQNILTDYLLAIMMYLMGSHHSDAHN